MQLSPIALDRPLLRKSSTVQEFETSPRQTCEFVPWSKTCAQIKIKFRWFSRLIASFVPLPLTRGINEDPSDDHTVERPQPHGDVMSRSLLTVRLLTICALALLCMVGFSETSWSQQQQLSYTRSTAIDQEKSRAETEAEQMVSLSADLIVGILNQEPGLMLEVKKALVRKAFEQGRILNPKDLTDEAIYRLVRENEDVRVIATKEIGDRSYIRAKPTREELARNMPCQPALSAEALAKRQEHGSQPSEAVQDKKSIPSQEQLYWAEHENDLDCYLTQYLPNGTAQSLILPPQNGQAQQQPAQQTQQGNPSRQQPYFQQPSPQQNSPSQYGPQWPSTDYHRQLDFTQMQQPSQGYFGMESDQDEMVDIQPEELPSLLSTSQTNGMSSFSGGGPGSMSGAGMSGMGRSSSLSSPLMNPLTSSMGSTGSMFGMQGMGINGSSFGTPGFPTQNTQGNQTYPQLQDFPPPKPPQQPRLRHQANPYADIPSLYDLYGQYSRHSRILQRFGGDIFLYGTGNLDELPMDLPVGPDYVVGPGDGLSIDMWGGVSQKLLRVIDREGRLALPEVGAVEVSGKSLGEVQHLVQTVLRGQFRNVGADVSLARLRTVRVYVVGDVERPGAYDVSSLSTPLNALYLAGGPTSDGSLRILEHYRGTQLVEKVDLYDLLLHGTRADMQRIQPGDTLRVPPLSDQVTVEGMVRRPAIYELNGEKSLAEVLQLAGGVLPTGTLRHMDVERVESHQSRTMLRLDIPETNSDASVATALGDFSVQDGDKIKVTPILPYADKTVYLDGHVSRPGKFAYSDGMKVTDLIKSYKDLLPEPSTSHAEIIRLSRA